MMFLLAGCCAAGALFLMLRFSLFLPAKKGLPVLLYHKVSVTHEDGLTIKQSALDAQLGFLRDMGYCSVSMRQLLDFVATGAPLPPKPVMITFDDGYESAFDLAYPLLKKYSCKAVFFVPSDGIGKASAWDADAEPLMSVRQLKDLDPAIVECGLHSACHGNYRTMTPDQIEADIRSDIEAMKSLEIPFVPAFAYPYGGRPKDPSTYRSMAASLGRAGVILAFRIGNRVNRLPIKDPLEVKRISVRGTDTMWTFKTKLTKGRVKQV